MRGAFDVMLGRMVEHAESTRRLLASQREADDDSRLKTLTVTEAEAIQLRTFLRSSWPDSPLRKRVEDLCD